MSKKSYSWNKNNTKWKSGKQGPNQPSRFINFFLSWLADCSVNCDSLRRGSEHTYWNVFDGEDDLRHVSGRQKTPDGDLYVFDQFLGELCPWRHLQEQDDSLLGVICLSLSHTHTILDFLIRFHWKE